MLIKLPDTFLLTCMHKPKYSIQNVSCIYTYDLKMKMQGTLVDVNGGCYLQLLYSIVR